jgi:hypothetical protein
MENCPILQCIIVFYVLDVKLMIRIPPKPGGPVHNKVLGQI